MMKKENVLNCMFSRWYPTFKNLTIPSRIISLPQEFIDYLNSDGVVLPETVGSFLPESQDSDRESDSEEWQALEETADTAVAPSFNYIDSRITEIIQEFGGAVFPKLNWSAPRDASWITHNGTLKCTCPAEVYLLLKSSDFISHDINECFKNCDDGEEGSPPNGYELVLRKWRGISPGMEFRCFVKDSQMIAITQRDHSNFYSFIKDHENEIKEDIQSFFDNKIVENFPDSNFVFDVYRYKSNKVLLIDFNPFSVVTDPLLFSWSELESVDASECECEIRFLSSSAGVQPSPYLSSRMPTDITDLTHGEDIHKLVDLLNVQGLIRTSYSSDVHE